VCIWECTPPRLLVRSRATIWSLPHDDTVSLSCSVRELMSKPWSYVHATCYAVDTFMQHDGAHSGGAGLYLAVQNKLDVESTLQKYGLLSSECFVPPAVHLHPSICM
jgi:hypothetical protein